MEFALDKVGPRDVGGRSLPQPDACSGGSQGLAGQGTTGGPQQRPRDSVAATVQQLPVPSKGVINMEHGRRARDVWEWSLSVFPQINHFVQSPEDPTVKNTAPGRGERGRKKQKGGVGKDMEKKRRDSRERGARGKGKRGTEEFCWAEDLA